MLATWEQVISFIQIFSYSLSHLRNSILVYYSRTLSVFWFSRFHYFSVFWSWLILRTGLNQLSWHLWKLPFNKAVFACNKVFLSQLTLGLLVLSISMWFELFLSRLTMVTQHFLLYIRVRMLSLLKDEVFLHCILLYSSIILILKFLFTRQQINPNFYWSDLL